MQGTENKETATPLLRYKNHLALQDEMLFVKSEPLSDTF